jgi:phosphohistidine swiveling domain-containing protein
MSMKGAWILPLDARQATLEIAGGKGANLARLVRKGFPVPNGFIVTTSAYRAYVAANNLDRFILDTVEDLQADDPIALAAVSDAIRARFAAGTLPMDLVATLRQAYARLGSPPVAVRSSATAEDLPEMSFAGQQDTFLNIVGDEALLEAVVNCWSSLWTARAIGYRARNDIPHGDLALALVVQEMVQSESSGVLFTANPLNGKRSETVIEATLGLGEALVSGQVEPDHYIVEVASGRILARTLGAKALSIRGRPGGGTITQPEQVAPHPALPDDAVAELARLGQQVAELFGAPQDVEWAWAGGRLYLLQSRPVTSLFPVPAGMAPEPLLVLFSFGTVQGLLGPMTPLGRGAIQAVFAGAGGLFGYRLAAETQNAIHEAAERLFVNITGLIRHHALRRVVRGAMPMLEPSMAQALESLSDDPRLVPTEGFNPGTFRWFVPLVLPVLGRLILSLLRPDVERARFERQIETEAAEFGARMGATGSLAERVALMDEILDRAFRFLLPRFIPRFAAGMGPLAMLTKLEASLPGGGHDALSMTRGMLHNVTTLMDLTLWQAAERIQADPAAADVFRRAEPETLAADYLAGRLPERVQPAVDGFLDGYGMRGVGEIDLGRPRWRENPTPIFQVLQSYLQIEDASQAPDAVFARGGAAAEEAIQRLADRVRQTRGGWLRARLVRWAARRVRALSGLRESPKFWAVCMMSIVRTSLLESGQGQVATGVLAQADDLFFLRLGELKALAAGQERDWAALVGKRRQVYAREGHRQQIPHLLLSDGQAFYEGVAVPEEEGVGVLAGSPVSPGVAEGVVHVVLDPHEARLAPGEILVCPGTDPAWTPLFLVAGGLVMEVGGLMTHGSVVAREYGIPAVVGVSKATTRLRTGQRVRLDGTMGQVTVLAD